MEMVFKRDSSLFLFIYFRCIKRIIFNSIVKPTVNEKGEKEIDSITTSQALQIAGRAGRFGSSFKQGEVTAMHRDDLLQLKEILSEAVPPVKVRVSLPGLYRCASVILKLLIFLRIESSDIEDFMFQLSFVFLDFVSDALT